MLADLDAPLPLDRQIALSPAERSIVAIARAEPAMSSC